MKKQIILILVAVVVIFTFLYFFNRTPEIDQHPSLTASAQMPDFYLKNVDHYEDEELHEMSAFNLEKAIESIWKLEKDVDEKSFQKLEREVLVLEEIHRRLLEDSIDIDEMRSAFEKTMSSLAHAELEIAEMYAETNHLNQANIALKYARLHIKNAMLFHNHYWKGDSGQLAIEKKVFQEMDSLLNNESASPVEYSMAIDKMIKEIDEILER